MQAKKFVQCLQEILRVEFFAGVPDSQLKALCDYLYGSYGVGVNHCIAHNEGGALALAAGHYLATGRVPCVYLQNSGIGNLVNPVCSLTRAEVYAIPTVFVVGWRGEPRVHDEPQHSYQGRVTLSLLRNLGITISILSPESTVEETAEQMRQFLPLLESGKSVAFVVRKNAFATEIPADYQNRHCMTREEAIQIVTEYGPDDIFVSTTGKASRELFEIRESRKQGHSHDFLTVGSMGHSAMIALGIALQKPNQRVFCLDGDGAVLMHTGAMAVVGSYAVHNYIHILLNNGAHESVGGMPTVSGTVNYPLLAKACGYRNTFSADDPQGLKRCMDALLSVQGPSFLEIKVSLGSRKNLGRPTLTPLKNKQDFMEFLK